MTGRDGTFIGEQSEKLAETNGANGPCRIGNHPCLINKLSKCGVEGSVVQGGLHLNHTDNSVRRYKHEITIPKENGGLGAVNQKINLSRVVVVPDDRASADKDSVWKVAP